ncbi:MAG: hypothetical protein GQF41_2480 [Candidatus Rifleibacterium amylolyticum]|nr:MAG: hypothetical protein GQF41_2480 [Candidatus Rifleibacterium amylolyticum]
MKEAENLLIKGLLKKLKSAPSAQSAVSLLLLLLLLGSVSLCENRLRLPCYAKATQGRRARARARA